MASSDKVMIVCQQCHRAHYPGPCPVEFCRLCGITHTVGQPHTQTEKYIVFMNAAQEWAAKEFKKILPDNLDLNQYKEENEEDEE